MNKKLFFKMIRLMLDDLIEDYSADPHYVPFILKYNEKEGVSKAKPGYTVCKKTNPSTFFINLK